MRALFVVVVAAICSCGGTQRASEPLENSEKTTPPPPPDTSEASPTEVERSDRQAVDLALKVIGEMVEAAATASGNCEQMGQQLSALATANRDLFEQMAAISADEQRAEILVEFREGSENVTTELFVQVESCAADPGVKLALEAMSP